MNKLQNMLDAVKMFENQDINEKQLKEFIFDYISDEDSIIPNMMEILQKERNTKSSMLNEMNIELSRSLCGYEDFNSQKKEHKNRREFIVKGIREYYIKWQNYIKATFKHDGLP